VDPKEVATEDVDRINPAQDRFQRRALVSMAMNLGVP
jgi:hypothetical protein